MDSKQQEAAIQLDGVSKSFPLRKGLSGLLLTQSWFLRLWLKIPGTKLENVMKSVLDDISLRIEPGEAVAIVGVNGAGKTTLTGIISGMIEADAGSVSVLGNAPGTGGRRTVSVVNPRELYGDFYPIEQLTFISMLSQQHSGQAYEAIVNLLERLGLERKALETQFSEDLSFGSKGKLALACGLLPLLNSKADEGIILLLDEPTQGFDVLAVEEFFTALAELRQLLPNLTVVLATNDVSEASFCDRSMALINGKLQSRNKVHRELCDSMVHVRSSRKAFAKLLIDDEAARLGEKSATDSTGKVTQPLVKADATSPLVGLQKIGNKRYSALRIFGWRAWQDYTRGWGLAVLVVLSLVLPNLLTLFAMADHGSRVTAYYSTLLGVFASLLLRESVRFHDRERTYFKMLETIFLSGIPRWKHLLAISVVNWAFQCVYTFLVALVLGYSLFGTGFWAVLPILRLDAMLGLLGAVVGMLVATQAVGLLVTFIPFVLKKVHSYFIVMMVPLFGILFSGIYYDLQGLPWLLRSIAEINPISYAAVAFREFLNLPAKGTLPAVDWLVSVTGLTRSYSALSLLLLMSLSYFALAGLMYSRLESLVRRAGRFQ